MGYDLYVCDTNGETDLPDMPKSKERWGPEWYFRKNIWGIGSLREFLLNTGMAFDVGDYGAQTPNGWAGTDGEGEFRFPDRDEFDSDEAYEAACDKVLQAHGPEVPGIPIHKLCDNSGWWVLPYECESALKIWESAGSPRYVVHYSDGDYDETDDLVTFLRSAAAHGGFRTY